jgi:hypothetical protein
MNSIIESVMESVILSIEISFNNNKITNKEKYMKLATNIFKQYFKKYHKNDDKEYPGYNFITQKFHEKINSGEISIIISMYITSKIIEGFLRCLSINNTDVIRYMNDFLAPFNLTRCIQNKKERNYASIIVSDIMLSSYSYRERTISHQLIEILLRAGFKPYYMVIERALISEDDVLMEIILQYFPMNSEETSKTYNEFQKELEEAKDKMGERYDRVLMFANAWLQ